MATYQVYRNSSISGGIISPSFRKDSSTNSRNPREKTSALFVRGSEVVTIIFPLILNCSLF